ncbi:MAG: hypothetical protein ABJN42_15945, partial [Roseibium sp.]
MGKAEARKARMKTIAACGLGVTVAGVLGMSAMNAYGVFDEATKMDLTLATSETSLLSRSGHIMAEHAFGVEAGLNELGVTLRPSLKSDLDDMRAERNDVVADAMSRIYEMGYKEALAGEWSEEGLNQLVEGALFTSYAENAVLAPDGANGPNETPPIALMNEEIFAAMAETVKSLNTHFMYNDIQRMDQLDPNLRHHLTVSAYGEMDALGDKIEAIVGGFDPNDVQQTTDMTVKFVEMPTPDEDLTPGLD